LHESGEFLGLRLFFFPLRGHLRLAAEHFSFQRSTRIWSRVLSLFSTNQTVAFLSLAFSLFKNSPPVDGFPVPSSGPSSGLGVVGFVVRWSWKLPGKGFSFSLISSSFSMSAMVLEENLSRNSKISSESSSRRSFKVSLISFTSSVSSSASARPASTQRFFLED